MNPPSISRRHFLGATGAGIALAGFPHIANADVEKQRVLKIGLIGAGGRGTGAAMNALKADPNVQLWAVGDAFAEAIPASLKQLVNFGTRAEVPESRRFVGLDAYQQVLDSGVDVVLLTAPPGFRPQHLRAAIDAGKHVFAEKPMAVDVAGAKSVLESARLAKAKHLSIQHGFCWRFAPGMREAFGKITSGELGRVVSVYSTFMSTPPKPLQAGMTKPDAMSDVEWQTRWWTNFEWLSGGPVLEQAIHSLDKISWAMGDVAPLACVATGGRAVRTDAGNVYDHYNAAIEYPGGVICHLGARQFPGCHAEIFDRISCEKGTIVGPDLPMLLDTDGKKRLWMHRQPAGQSQDMYQICHNEFFAALRKGEPIDASQSTLNMAHSTMLALLVREAAHTGQRLTWQQLWTANQDLAPDTLKFGDAFPVAPVPVPGKYQLS